MQRLLRPPGRARICEPPGVSPQSAPGLTRAPRPTRYRHRVNA